MSFARSLPVFISVLISAGLWLPGTALTPAEERGSYAALVCSGAIPDREIRERLENRGVTGLVSESGQWVLLDCFGSIERIPLDEYDSRILPFDPRNDGYAQKLRSLFVRDGKRFIYIPAQGAGIEQKLASALGDIPYSFEYARRSRSDRPVFLFCLFCLAAGALCAIRPLRRAVQPHAAGLIPCLPALAPLAAGGAAGFALASLLAGCAVLIAGPCLERFTMPRRRSLPPLLCWLLPPFLIICYVILAFFSGLSSVFALLVLVFFGGILAFSLWSASASGVRIMDNVFVKRRSGEHRRFYPVPILKPRTSGFAFSWAMLPFAAAAVVLACAGSIMSPSTPANFSGLPDVGAVTEADYYAHYRFQSTFSERSLHAFQTHDESEAFDGMGAYELAPDGLPDQILGGELSARGGYEKELLPDGVPPFPLGDALRYPGKSGRGKTAAYELLFVLLPLFFILPILFQGKAAGERQLD